MSSLQLLAELKSIPGLIDRIEDCRKQIQNHFMRLAGNLTISNTELSRYSHKVYPESKPMGLLGLSRNIYFTSIKGKGMVAVVVGDILGSGSFGIVHECAILPEDTFPYDLVLKKFIVSYHSKDPIKHTFFTNHGYYQTRALGRVDKRAFIALTNSSDITEEFNILSALSRQVARFTSKKNNLHPLPKGMTPCIKEFILQKRVPGCSFAAIMKSSHTAWSIFNNYQMLPKIFEMDIHERTKIGRALLTAVWQMHNHLVLHNDIKLENMMLYRHLDGNYEVNIVDFGSSFVVPVKQNGLEAQFTIDLARAVTTTSYCAIEAIEGKNLSFKSDMYSVGVCLFRLLSHDLVKTEAFFYGRNKVLLKKPLLDSLQDYSMQLEQYFDPHITALLKRLLAPSASSRYFAIGALLAFDNLNSVVVNSSVPHASESINAQEFNSYHPPVMSVPQSECQQSNERFSWFNRLKNSFNIKPNKIALNVFSLITQVVLKLMDRISGVACLLMARVFHFMPERVTKQFFPDTEVLLPKVLVTTVTTNTGDKTCRIDRTKDEIKQGVQSFNPWSLIKESSFIRQFYVSTTIETFIENQQTDPKDSRHELARRY